MPTAALRPCPVQRCPNLVRSGRCEAHGGERKAWRSQAPPPERLRGRANQKARIALFAREPLCRPCSEAGRTRLATIRDHVIPLTQGGTETTDNEQPICADCHQVKTQREAEHGARLAR